MDKLTFRWPGARVVFVCAALLLAVGAGRVQAQERWAALSVLGDKMTLVFARMQTGTNTNPNLTQPIPMKDNVLDKLAMRAFVESRVNGVPEIVALGLRDPRYYEMQERLFASDGQPLLDGLRKALENARITHVLLISKLRADARFNIGDGFIGIGLVEGLGFYVDRSTKVQRIETGKVDAGYMAPFAFYRLALFDLARNQVIAQEDVKASKAHPLASTGEIDPWEVLTPEQKIDEMERLLNESAGPALGRLAAKRG